MMKVAPAALAVGLFFLAGLAGGVYWRTVAIGPAGPDKSDKSPTVLPDHNPKITATEPATPMPPADGASMTAPLASVAPRPEPPPPQASAAVPSGAAPDDNATMDHGRTDHPHNDLPVGSSAAHKPVTKPAAPASQERVTVAKTQPPHPGADGRQPANANGPFQVQFGVFTNEENARRLSQALSTPQVKIFVQRGQDRTGRPLFYVRSPVFDEFARALAAAWDAQNAAQTQHFAEPVKYVILHGPAGGAMTGGATTGGAVAPAATPAGEIAAGMH